MAAPTSASSAEEFHRRGERRADLGWRQRPQRDDAATRTQRRRYGRQAVADQQQEGAPWRLFQHLEQRIGAETIELIHRIDDGDPPSPLPGGRAEKRNRAVDVLDSDLLAHDALVVRRALKNEEVGMRPRRNASRDRMRGIDGKRRRCLHLRRRRIGMRQGETGEPISERRLADAFRPDEQKGVRNPSAAIRGKERGLGERVAGQPVGHARMRCLGRLARGRAHEARFFSKTKGAMAGSRREFTVAQMRLATSSLVALASTITQRSGSDAASVR